MIKSDQLTRIGLLLKPHGIKGEIVAEMDSDIDLSALRCIVLDIDGIYVPFFLNSVRPRSAHSSLILIDEINDENGAKSLCGKDVFALTEELDAEFIQENEDGFFLSDLIGFEVYDDLLGFIGKIEDFDDSTENYLLIVRDKEDNIIYIPLAEEFISGIDSSENRLDMTLPEGLVDLNNK